MRHVVLIMLTSGLLTAGNAQAQTSTSLVPSVSFGTTYDNNLFARTSGDAGVMTVLRPSLEANYESPTLNASSLFSFDVQHSNFPALSTLDARRHGNIDISRRATTAMTLAVGVRYDRTETPGELNVDTGILGRRRTAERWELVPSLVYRGSPLTTITASYNGMTETLVDDIRGTMHVVRAGVTHRATEHDDYSISVLSRRFVDSIDTRTSNAVLAGWTREVAYATRLSLQAGPRLSSGKTLAPEIVAGFNRATNRMRIGMDYWHGETIILGIHGPVAVDSATAKLAWPLTPRTEVGLQSGITDSTTVSREQVRVYRAVVLGAWTPHGGSYTFSASYGAEFQRGLILNSFYFNEQVMRHTLRVNVTIAPRLSRTFRPTGEPPVVHTQGASQ